MPPPPDLSRRRLPLKVLKPGDRLVRVHTLGRDPLFFGPAAGSAPTGRWDSPERCFTTCYFADVAHPSIAFAERFLRDPQRTLIPEAEIRRGGVSVVQVEQPLAIVQFHGASLRRLGATAAVVHGDHRESRLWAQALYDHRDAPNGVRWRSRVDDDGFAVALFDRGRQALRIRDTQPLLEARSILDLEACLDRYAAAVVEEHSRSGES
jgi:hypothetical protein